ncbi:MAG: alpha/beta fold hydrolase [Bacteroidales bacterium]|nr:alpha/beta fold hydrolase [Bacteroidales bacterium]
MTKKALSIILSLFVLSASSIPVTGKGIILKQSDSSGIYRKGQKISVRAFTGENKGDSIFVRVLKNNLTELLKISARIETDSLLLFQGSFDEPCSVIVEAHVSEDFSSLGFVVSPGHLKPGGEPPADFAEYWEKERSNLLALPYDIKRAAVKDSFIDTGYSCENIEINCTGPRPARGYFAKPAIAAPKSLPIVLLVHAAGVKGSWCRSEPGNALKYAKMGALCFDLNAHGMLNGQPDSYYEDLESGELKLYFLQGLTNRDDFYFRGMYLRLMRTIDFLTKQPEWDGKRILVIGESQGGGQALAAAGLDKRVSAVVAIVPAMCDWLGPLTDHEGGWPQPLKSDLPREEILRTIPYFDAAYILKRSKATLFVEIGLIDITCPAVSVYAAVNRAKGKKLIYAVPYRAHHQPQNYMEKTWQETVYKPRETFIREYLK